MPLPVPTQSIAACTKTRAATLPNRAHEHARIRCRRRRRLKFPTELYIYTRRCPNAAIATPPLPAPARKWRAVYLGGVEREDRGGREPALHSRTAAAAACTGRGWHSLELGPLNISCRFQLRADSRIHSAAAPPLVTGSSFDRFLARVCCLPLPRPPPPTVGR